MGWQTKTDLRQRYLSARNALPNPSRDSASKHICSLVAQHTVFLRAHMVHCYLSMGSEVDTHPLISHALAIGKRVCIPVWERHSDATAATEITSLETGTFATGAFGLAVPRVIQTIALDEIDLMIVPLLAYMELPAITGAPPTAHRLGYGAGYYDRLLSRTTAPRIGVAFAMQRTNALPIEPHDQLLDQVITNE